MYYYPAHRMLLNMSIGAAIGFILSIVFGFATKAVENLAICEERNYHWVAGVLGNPPLILVGALTFGGAGFAFAIPVLLDKFFGQVGRADDLPSQESGGTIPVSPKSSPPPAPPRIRRHHI